MSNPYDLEAMHRLGRKCLRCGELEEALRGQRQFTKAAEAEIARLRRTLAEAMSK